jgi:predicted GTPase
MSGATTTTGDLRPGKPVRVVILGAAGRDFHDFNVVYRDDPGSEVVAFTAAQIPNIAGRVYPPELAGPHYPGGIPIVPEAELDRLIREHSVERVIFAYSDVPHAEVMHRASIALAAGADFCLLGPRRTQLRSTKPVLAICAVRTGAGKSPATRYACRVLTELGHRVVAVRHPMPYGDLARQAVQRFADPADLDRHECTVEEREEYEPLLEAGVTVFAGVDYEPILRAAERETDVIVWDGGNNDLPFFAPDLHVVLADACRPGHERTYHPGEANARAADVLVISKVDTARPEAIRAVREVLRGLNPRAAVAEAALSVRVDDPAAIRGRRVLVVEDGPTVTHGGMPHGAGWLAAVRLAAEVVDPRPWAVGSLRDVYSECPHLGPVLPAMGYGRAMIAELEQTVNAVPADAVLAGTPIDLGRLLRVNKPVVRARYEFRDAGRPSLADILRERFGRTMQPSR